MLQRTRRSTSVSVSLMGHIDGLHDMRGKIGEALHIRLLSISVQLIYFHFLFHYPYKAPISPLYKPYNYNPYEIPGAGGLNIR